ncbi:hypothetical protein GCM10007160_40230 [Litchfieldella qijiaojingensis]|uniref:Methyl-accepting chemotaxis protein n=1 Tax=Litchfieldella qijiaojingensis TaxID=980347 RepID=A0ABQ2ZAP2_9GAMM|nr:hypothetical protein [Halomonas qijiaojingensis]GGY08830.1 hypothetical protein GCM10007160_40230 [Halomonas qijiaojingensis]
MRLSVKAKLSLSFGLLLVLMSVLGFVAIQQLDKVTQQNTSAAEEMSVTAEELSSQAEQLQAAIAYFRVDDQAALTLSGAKRAPSVSKALATVKTPRPKHEKTSSGFTLDMRDADDALDVEFERSESA